MAYPIDLSPLIRLHAEQRSCRFGILSTRFLLLGSMWSVSRFLKGKSTLHKARLPFCLS